MTVKKQTALITGASSGLGAEFSRELAKQGYDLVIAARRLDRLKALATELETAHGIKVTAIESDLSIPGAAQNLALQIAADKTIQIDYLVNNSGFGHVGAFVDEGLQAMTDELAVNITALTQLTRIYLPGMVERNHGTVINVASTAAYQPLPNMAVYGASKAYVLAFTEALWGEVLGTRVKVLALSPGGTATEFFDVAGGRSMGSRLAKPQDVISTAMAALAQAKNPPSVIVGSANRVTSALVRFVPRKGVIAMAKNVMKSNPKTQ